MNARKSRNLEEAHSAMGAAGSGRSCRGYTYSYAIPQLEPQANRESAPSRYGHISARQRGHCQWVESLYDIGFIPIGKFLAHISLLVSTKLQELRTTTIFRDDDTPRLFILGAFPLAKHRAVHRRPAILFDISLFACGSGRNIPIRAEGSTEFFSRQYWPTLLTKCGAACGVMTPERFGRPRIT